MALEFVTKRNGEKQVVDWSKVDGRLNYLNSYPSQLTCNASFVAHRVREMGIENGMATKMLDERAAKMAAEMASHNPDYLVLSARISVSNHHKNTFDCFSSTMDACYRNRKQIGRKGRTMSAPRINSKLYKFVQLHKNKLNRMIDYDRDYRFTDFGFATLMDRYLIKRSGPKDQVEARPQDYAIERPQDMWLRAACAIHMNRNNLADESVLDAVEETYNGLSSGRIMHATPTLYNAGTLCEQFLSCFLAGGSDSIEGISKLEGDLKKLSKYAGGIGFWWPLRSSGSEVSTTNGTSDGPIPFLRCIESSMRAVNQGGKRAGSAANYEDPAHPDIMQWLRLRRHNEPGAIDKLFYALWIHDEFMIRIEQNQLWYFVDPHEHPELYNATGAEYSRIYNAIVAAEEYRGEPVPARAVMMELCRTQAEAGMPYVLFADACNEKSNQKNIGTIRSSNLCVAGDTPILTERGWVRIDSVSDQVLQVWNGNEWSTAIVRQTNESAQLLEIETSDGCILRCTPEHEFLIPDPDGNSRVKVPASQLKPGQQLAKIPELPVMDNGREFRNDGDEVPVNYGLKSKLEWLAQFIDSNGQLHNDAIRVDCTRVSPRSVKLMCQTMGANPDVSAHAVTFSRSDLWQLFRLGLNTDMQITVTSRPYDHRVTISRITAVSEPEPTWCFGEPLRNCGMFAGLLTGQCAEVLLYSSPEEYACCAISSVCVNAHVVPCDCNTVEAKWIPGHVDGHQQGCNGTHRVDYDGIARSAATLTRNLNKITDINFYPLPETRRSQMRHRPIGVGSQGLADLFHILQYPFESMEAQAENRRVFESIYYGCMRQSVDLAMRDGAYETFLGDALNNPEHPDMPSPFSQGVFQFDMWGIKSSELMGRWDWTALKRDAVQYGVRNSQLTSLPPTASTSHIQGNSECHEPTTDNIYVRKTLSGENLVVNQYLVRDLMRIGLWNPTMRARIVAARGSVQNLDIPDALKRQYRSVWEMDNRILIDMDAARGPFVDQTQSSNRFMAVPTAKKLFSMHMRCWKRGLKTGMYYLRSMSGSKATQFSESAKAKAAPEEQPEEQEEQEEQKSQKDSEPTEEQAMICMLKKVNGIACYTCQ